MKTVLQSDAVSSYLRLRFSESKSAAYVGKDVMTRAARYASANLVLPDFAAHLRKGTLWTQLDLNDRDALEAARVLNEDLCAALRRQCVDVVTHLRAVGVDPVFLKGAGLILSGRELNRYTRFISDIDLLVEQTELDTVVSALMDQGYWCAVNLPSSLAESWCSKHLRPLVHQKHPFALEIHVRPFDMSRGLASDLTTASVLRDARGVDVVVGGNTHRVLVPSPRDMLFHAFHHAWISDAGYDFGLLPTRALLDIGGVLAMMDKPDLYAILAERNIKHSPRLDRRIREFCWLYRTCMKGEFDSDSHGDDLPRRSRLRLAAMGQVGDRPKLLTWQRRAIFAKNGLATLFDSTLDVEREALRRCNPDDVRFLPAWQQLLLPGNLHKRWKRYR